ncbi:MULTISPECIES: GntR family transcriptional regulator [Prauserella salsuginis group]|uniref:GntR family transcriptional regulator n=1 Tax=Prauserella salsuginis TaxID=387889 RepID=A0ABW6G4W3_9PSEU|nr:MULTISPECIES: GntR family transcriptional regulator [Prauserella salsuginis group]MCR3718744.1 GntR family transcriptional regulator [Prauserella flava]MCR3733314.1 GntR family transcriptional regulator [Prauserella salsuginis]
MNRTDQDRPTRFSKRDRLVHELSRQIHTGVLTRGQQLPAEHELAERFEVSRGTVRSALSELQRRELIATQTGVGSFVTFDGVELDQTIGWATALSRSGFDIRAELLDIEKAADPELTARFGVAEFIAVRRLRRDRAAGPVSYEVALVPKTGELANLPRRGLVDDSLTATLAAAGLHPARGEQWIGTESLTAHTAELLERREGELFLRATRTSTDSAGGLVEHVISLLDPARFQFHLTFGTA